MKRCESFDEMIPQSSICECDPRIVIDGELTDLTKKYLSDAAKLAFRHLCETTSCINLCAEPIISDPQLEKLRNVCLEYTEWCHDVCEWTRDTKDCSRDDVRMAALVGGLSPRCRYHAGLVEIGRFARRTLPDRDEVDWFHKVKLDIMIAIDLFIYDSSRPCALDDYMAAGIMRSLELFMVSIARLMEVASLHRGNDGYHWACSVVSSMLDLAEARMIYIRKMMTAKVWSAIIQSAPD